MERLHILDLVYSDINPDNIMLRNGSPVLIDFELYQPFGKRLQSLARLDGIRVRFIPLIMRMAYILLEKYRSGFGLLSDFEATTCIALFGSYLFLSYWP